MTKKYFIISVLLLMGCSKKIEQVVYSINERNIYSYTFIDDSTFAVVYPANIDTFCVWIDSIGKEECEYDLNQYCHGLFRIRKSGGSVYYTKNLNSPCGDRDLVYSSKHQNYSVLELDDFHNRLEYRFEFVDSSLIESKRNYIYVFKKRWIVGGDDDFKNNDRYWLEYVDMNLGIPVKIQCYSEHNDSLLFSINAKFRRKKGKMQIR